LADHVNSALLGGAYLWPALVGRAALPVFVVAFAENLTLSPDRLQRSASRLWVASLLAQPAFVLAFDGPWWGANILVLFAVVAQALRWGL
ncbi:TraX family protein, partial [Parvimonas sp. D4]|uniref:TraX family protein n=1 Tax=Parvimonas sp. D4 TaxID=3110690 RepID=UPI002B491A2E